MLAAALILAAIATPASAANKEHQQMMADIRMLQEQTQLLQNTLGLINEAIKAVNTRLDDQTNTLRKAFADQKLLIDNLGNDLRVVREKVDDNNVRVASLSQELTALRQAVQQATVRPSLTESGPPPSGTTPPGGTAPAPPPAPAAAIGASPTQLYEAAWSDYAAGQWDLAILGFESYIRSFPKSEQAADAQVKIGQAHDYAGNKARALESFDKAIRDYPNSKVLAEAYFRKGLVLRDLKQPDRAKEAFESAIKVAKDTNPSVASLAQQALDQMKK